MSTSPRKVASVLTVLLLASASAWAATTIQGDVKGPDGHALGGAEVQLQPKGQKSWQTVKADARGRYVFNNLATGSYNITAKANGMAATAAQNVVTSDRGAIRVNFNLKNQTGAGTAKAASTKKAKKMVWMEPEMGSHLGGRWVEVNDDGTSSDGASHVDSVKKQDTIRKMLGGGGINKAGN